jgi:predicted dehydrogenase
VQLAAALHGGGHNPVPLAEALPVIAVVETAIRSAAEGRSLTLPLSDAEIRAFAG